MDIDRLHHQWLAHPATGRLRTHLQDRLRELEGQLLDLAGPGQDREERIAYFGARRELLALIEHIWVPWETSET